MKARMAFLLVISFLVLGGLSEAWAGGSRRPNAYRDPTQSWWYRASSRLHTEKIERGMRTFNGATQGVRDPYGVLDTWRGSTTLGFTAADTILNRDTPTNLRKPARKLRRYLRRKR